MNARSVCRILGMGAAAVLGAVLFALAQTNAGPGEQERKVEESQVPPPALAALKALAGEARITEFAEEIEHGHTYYEGSWAGPHGNVDGLVTAAGDLVEIEETVAEPTVPKPVLAKARAAAGPYATLRFEKKTVVYYEVKFRKDDRYHEIVLSPDGRQREHEEEEEHEESDD
jgi:hypothetical protein